MVQPVVMRIELLRVLWYKSSVPGHMLAPPISSICQSMTTTWAIYLGFHGYGLQGLSFTTCKPSTIIMLRHLGYLR